MIVIKAGISGFSDGPWKKH